LSRIGQELEDVLEDLRKISRGLHPAILSEAGLRPALMALARRSAVPVELDVRVEKRLPESVEVAAYYVVSEGLANASSTPTPQSPKSRSKRLRATCASQSGTTAGEAQIPPEVPG